MPQAAEVSTTVLSYCPRDSSKKAHYHSYRQPVQLQQQQLLQERLFQQRLQQQHQQLHHQRLLQQRLHSQDLTLCWRRPARQAAYAAALAAASYESEFCSGPLALPQRRSMRKVHRSMATDLEALPKGICEEDLHGPQTEPRKKSANKIRRSLGKDLEAVPGADGFQIELPLNSPSNSSACQTEDLTQE
jgi:hypothetical protein